MEKNSEVKTKPQESADPGGEEPMLYCPVCSSRLIDQKCKLVCGNCGYFMSCSDYV